MPAPTKAYMPETPYTNGVVVAMPVKKAVIELDDIGYPGWKCEVRTNPRSEVWDQFLDENKTSDETWEIVGSCIISWNFGNEDGELLPLPPATKRKDLPIEVPSFIITKFIDAINAVVQFPKVQSANSDDSSQTKNET